MTFSLLRVVRQRKGLSQYDLSSLCGIPNYRLSLIENKRRQPKPEELQNLSKALGVNVDEILQNEKLILESD